MRAKTQGLVVEVFREAPEECPWYDGDGIDRIEKLIDAVEDCWDEDDFKDPLTPSIQQSITGLQNLRSLAAAMTVCLLDLPIYGFTKPVFTSKAIAFLAPDVHSRFGEARVRAVCEEVQYSVLPGQSALFQEKFDEFNRRYFDGRLPEYKILVVYDAWYWFTERCGLKDNLAPSFALMGFIDEEGQRIFIRVRIEMEIDGTMVNTLIHEMAHAAAGVGHGDNWKAEMLRLKHLGAPINELDLLDEITPQDVINLKESRRGVTQTDTASPALVPTCTQEIPASH